MGFPVAITSGQKTTLRTSNYWQRTFIAFNPGEIVFQAEVSETITDAPFLEFAWTDTIEGDYEDVWAGMVCYISATVDYQKAYKYRGRVRLAPDATTFSIDLNATILTTGDIITVVRDADLFARIRQDTLVDGSITYHNLPPQTTGLPSVVVLYDADDDDEALWTPAQTGIAVAPLATIASYAWAVSGTGMSTISDPDVQNPNFTFEAGKHYLVRLITTDSNGVANFRLVQVYAIDRTFSAPVILPAAAGSVRQDLDNGYTGSITAYGGVADLPYRTHAVIFAVERFGDNSSTPIVTNVLMHGRLRSENITTEGSDEAGAVQTVTYPIEGITAYMQRLKMPNDIVRHVAAPDEWGEMLNPTPYRMAVYALYAYSNLLNLVSFSAGDSLFDAWRRGGIPVSVDGGYALDVLTTLMAFVDAAPNYAPDGEIRCEINASYKVDRSGLVTVMDFLVEDVRSYTLDIDTSRSTAQVIGYGGSWNTTNNTFVLYTAMSPTIPYSDAPEQRELTRILLQHDSTVSEAAAELAARTGNDFAFHNPKWLLSAVMRDSHRWLVATNYQRYTFTLAATTNLREIALTTATKFQCQAVDISIGIDGTYEVTPEFVEETEFSDAQSIASLLPNNLEGMNPVFPALSDDPAFPDDPLWSYPTDTPTLEELNPIDPHSAYLSYSPWTPDQAEDAAQRQGDTNCRAFQVYMRNPGTTNGPVTVSTEPYTLVITGSGRIAIDAWSQGSNLTQTNGGFAVVGGGSINGDWISGTGWKPDLDLANSIRQLYITRTFTAAAALGHVDIRFDAVAPTAPSQTQRPIAIQGYLASVQQFQKQIDPMTAYYGNGMVYSWDAPADEGAPTVLVDELRILIVPGNQGGSGSDPTGDATLYRIDLSGTGDDPDGNPGTNTQYGDYFYRFTDDNDAELFGATEGGLLDGNKPAVIPDYNPNHRYVVPYTGTGNALQAAYALSDYTNVQNRVFTIQVCHD